MYNWPILLAVAAALSVASGIQAQAQAGEHVHGPQAHAGHDAGQGANAPSDKAAVSAYRQANDRMHANMAVEFTGNADVDFLRGMIPHH